VCDEVAALQQQVDIVGRSAFHAVRRVDPSRVFRRAPVQLRRHFAAQLFDGALDGFVGVAPVDAGVGCLFFVGIVVIGA
jgi:hypothetical protein